jgi:hypothetical protein
MAHNGRGRTHVETGIDVDAGDRMVELMKPRMRGR